MALTGGEAEAVVEVRDPERLARFLHRHAALHVYALADLEEPLWSSTRWFALQDVDGELAAVALWFRRTTPPVLYAVCPSSDAATGRLLRALDARLPRRMDTDLGPGFVDVFARGRSAGPARPFLKMALGSLTVPNTEAMPEPLGPEDLDELAAFYAGEAYAAGEADGRYFDPYMLELGPYYGIRRAGRLVSVGGVHVRSRRYGVAAVGNVATAPAHRGAGLGGVVAAAVCRDLADYPVVALNVEASNEPAIRCYRGLGFEVVGEYVEQSYDEP